EGAVIFDITADEDVALTVRLDAAASADHLLPGSAKKMELKAGEPQSVKMTFGGYAHSYTVSISADNTLVYIFVKK
ncbi:MAG: hypothetical protein IJW21_04285, partial [Clostridia bacterium]|nr:hypothetical protein [Clostridia bacterium]